jgi:hypothetical protein
MIPTRCLPLPTDVDRLPPCQVPKPILSYVARLPYLIIHSELDTSGHEAMVAGLGVCYRRGVTFNPGAVLVEQRGSEACATVCELFWSQNHMFTATLAHFVTSRLMRESQLMQLTHCM